MVRSEREEQGTRVEEGREDQRVDTERASGGEHVYLK